MAPRESYEFKGKGSLEIEKEKGSKDKSRGTGVRRELSTIEERIRSLEDKKKLTQHEKNELVELRTRRKKIIGRME